MFAHIPGGIVWDSGVHHEVGGPFLSFYAVFVVCKPYVYRTEPSEADFLFFSWIALS